MATKPSGKYALGFMLLGALLLLAVEGASYGVYRMMNPPEVMLGDGPIVDAGQVATADDPAAASTDIASTGMQADSEAGAMTGAGGHPARDQTGDDDDEASATTTAGAVRDQSTGSAGPAEDSAEAEGGENAEEALSDEELAAREAAFVREHFEEHKQRLMAMIDDYFALPLDERPEYLKASFKAWGEQVQDQREAAGLPRESRSGPAVFHTFMGQMRESGTPEERLKMARFIGDVISMKSAEAQVRIDESLGVSPDGTEAETAPTPYAP